MQTRNSPQATGWQESGFDNKYSANVTAADVRAESGFDEEGFANSCKCDCLADVACGSQVDRTTRRENPLVAHSIARRTDEYRTAYGSFD